MTGVQSGYAHVNGLNMYYEIQGAGQPLILLHGGISTIGTSFGKLRPALAGRWKTIAVEQQAHGHTADIDRPLRFEQMADDTAALLGTLGIAKADFLGYSDGGNVAFAVAIRHPELMERVVLAGTNFNNEGLDPDILKKAPVGSITEQGRGCKKFADGIPRGLCQRCAAS